MNASPKIRVRFAVESDEQAVKITALLEALGYRAQRELDQGPGPLRLRWAVSRLVEQARLTEREREILTLVLHGDVNGEISEALGISKATVKWHMHNIFTKTGASSREALLREALQLDGSAPPSVAADDTELDAIAELDAIDITVDDAELDAIDIDDIDVGEP